MVRRSKEGHLARSHLPIKTTRNTSLVFRKRLAFESENRVRRSNGLAVNGTARTPSGRGFKSRYDQFGNPLEKKNPRRSASEYGAVFCGPLWSKIPIAVFSNFNKFAGFPTNAITHLTDFSDFRDYTKFALAGTFRQFWMIKFLSSSNFEALCGLPPSRL